MHAVCPAYLSLLQACARWLYRHTDLFTHVHVFFLAAIRRFPTLSDFQPQNGQLYGCVLHISKDMVLLKMDPQLEGAVEVHPFSQTNMKFEPISLLFTLTQSLRFYTRNSWIYSVNKNIKRFAEIENLYLLRFCVLPIPPKARIFPSRRQSYHSWWENMMIKEQNWASKVVSQVAAKANLFTTTNS